MSNTNQSDATQFPIRELSARTQVNTITLRAWERRYGLLKPTRTAKGHRLYSDKDVLTVEKILALVARGVRLGKVKPLLQEGVVTTPAQSGSESWQARVAQLTLAATTFTNSKLQHLIREAFASYPANICKEQLVKPAFTELAQLADGGAALAFAESELIAYTLLRLNTNASVNKAGPNIALVAATQAPIWRLAVMALELSDNDFNVHLLSRPFSVTGGINLAESAKKTYTVFYQDGVWKHKEQEQVATALKSNPCLYMCGTATVLTPMANDGQVYADVASCVAGLLTLK